MWLYKTYGMRFCVKYGCWDQDLLRIPLAPARHLVDGLLSGQMRIQFQELLDCLFAYGFCAHVVQYVPEII